MNGRRFIWFYVGLSTLLIFGLVHGNLSIAQTTSPDINLVKLDQYEDLPSDDEAARLDLLAERLTKQANLRGYIVAYSDPRIARGSYLRRINGIRKYLTEARGVEASRIVVVDGGYKQAFGVELWLTAGSMPPILAPTMPPPVVNNKAAYKFDEECLDCSPAVALVLYGLDEGLRFYAAELLNNPKSRALIIVRRDRNLGAREALKEVRSAKSVMVRRFGIEANRIVIKVGRRRNDGASVAEMWIVPPLKSGR